MGRGIFSRRKVLESGLLLVPAVALAPSLAMAAGACANAADSLRASLHYAEMGPDAKMTCADCGFFVLGRCRQCGVRQLQDFQWPGESEGSLRFVVG